MAVIFENKIYNTRDKFADNGNKRQFFGNEG